MRTWPALLLAPSLALADQSLTYMLVGWSCASQNHALPHGVHAAFLLAVLVTIAAAWRSYRIAQVRLPGDEGEPGPRRFFVAQTALMVGALSAAIIVAMWIPQWMLAPCLA